MQVYFARSIRGQHSEGEKFFFESIIDTIKSQGCTVAHETKAVTRLLNDVDRDRYVYQRDLEWIFNSQAMIAEVSNPSLGVGYEIAYAEHFCEIPILTVALKDTNVSAMIKGSQNVFFYRDTSDLKAEIENFLQEVAANLVENDSSDGHDDPHYPY